MERLNTTNPSGKTLRRLFVAVCAVCCLALSLPLSCAAAICTFRPLEVHDFRSDTETVYAAPRAKEVLVSGASQWKLTDAGEAKKNADGLTVPAGILVLYKNDPLTAMEDFRLEIAYRTAAGDGTADGETAFVYMSDALFGKSLVLNDPAVLLSVAENGDVYVSGEKINHASSAPAEDTLTAKNPAIGETDDCVLTLEYQQGALSVILTHHGAARELVKDFPCTLSGIRQMQLGGDKTAAKRIENITYKTVTFSAYGEYVPTAGVKALVQSGDKITEYTSIDSAFGAVCANTAAGVRLQLCGDATLSKPVKLAKGASFTLDLNGYTLDRHTGGRMVSDGYVFLLDENAALTVEDSAPERKKGSSGIAGGVITGGAGDDVGGGFQLKKGARLTMTGGAVSDCVTNDHGGAIRVAGSGVTVTLKNAGFYCNMTCDSTDNCHGGAIYSDYEDCTVTADGCIFEGNYSEDNGGAVYVNDGEFHASGCLFSDNMCLDDGGAVYIESGARATLDACDFRLNRANGDGGAVYGNSSEGTRLSGSYRYNTAGEDGGAICVCGNAVSIADAEIRDNTAGSHGGGVYVDELYDVSVQGCLVIRDNNSAKNLRDNLYLDDFGLTEAKVWCGGLDAGSEVWIRTGDDEHTVCENISAYQKRYFWQDDSAKSFQFTADGSKTETLRLITSAIGSGDPPLIFFGIGVMLIAGTVFVAVNIHKRKGGANDREK